MKILKSLMAGSAMAVFASGAYAADASGPEPSEFVRACDIYGSGFYYMPGTSTCVNFSGRVRVDFSSQNFDQEKGDNNDNSSFSHSSGRAQFDIRNESDYGTVKSVLRLDGGSNTSVARGTIEVGDFLNFGFFDTFWSRNNGYGTPTSFDPNYGYEDSVFAEIKAVAGDASFTIGIEETNSDGASDPDGDGDRDPNLYAGLKYTNGDWGWFSAHVLHQSDAVGANAPTAAQAMAIEMATTAHTAAMNAHTTAPDPQTEYALNAAQTALDNANNALHTEDGDTAWGVSVEITAIENINLQAYYHGDGGDTSIIPGDNDRQFGIGATYSFGDWSIGGGYTSVDGSDNEADEATTWTADITWSIAPGLSATLAYQDENSEDDGGMDDGSQDLRLRMVRSW